MLRFSSLSSQFDSEVSIAVEELQVGQRITICSRIENGQDKFGAFAYYQANNLGVVDLRASPSFGGSFTGVVPMGLITHILQLPGQRKGLRLMPKDVTKPLVFHFTVLEGHVYKPFDTKALNARVITQGNCYRTLLHPTVERVEIREEGFVGVLFCPKDVKEPLPGVIDMYGTGGGLIEYRAALLASHNFVVFHLAYFGVKGLPDNYFHLDLEYFEKAIRWFLKDPRIIPNRIGTIGLSYGADFAINTALICPQIKAVVPINPNHSTFFSSVIKYKGNPVSEFPEFELEQVDMTDDMIRFATHKRKYFLDSPHCFPMEKSNAKFLFITGGDDLMTPFESSLKLESRLRQFGKAQNCQVLIYPKTGHLIEPPHFPFCSYNWNKYFGKYQLSGGEQEYHIEAQKDFWLRVTDFLRQTITANDSRL